MIILLVWQNFSVTFKSWGWLLKSATFNQSFHIFPFLNSERLVSPVYIQQHNIFIYLFIFQSYNKVIVLG